MNLYRLDYMNPDGTVRAPVRDLCGDYLTTAYAKARRRAIETPGVIGVTRIGTAGHLRLVAVVGDDGRVHRA